MEKVVLKAEMREDLGKGGCKHLRKTGQVPAVVYKEGKKGFNIKVDTNDLWHVLHTEAGENVIITVDISVKDKNLKKTVIVQDMQLDPINDKFMHVDFHEISLTEKLKVKVPIVVKGEAVGVKEDEGVLSQVLWELEVECLPTAIPEHIDVNVEELRIGDAIHIKDMSFPQDVEVHGDPEQVVLSVHLPHIEEEETPEEEAEGAEEAEEPEVIKKGKKEEEEAPAEEEAPPAEGKS